MKNHFGQYAIVHKNQSSFEAEAILHFPELCLIIEYLRPKIVLDFGCGKGNLIKKLSLSYPDIEFYGYDPAIPGRDILPVEKADLVINTDVLERIPEDMLPGIVKKISSLSNNVFFGLHHAFAYQILPDGENAHCTVKPKEWYYEFLGRYFKYPYPLPGRRIELSALITFAPSIDFLHAYHDLACPPLTDMQEQRPVVIQEQRKFLPRRLGLLLSCFIVKKKNRHHFREKYVRNKR